MAKEPSRRWAGAGTAVAWNSPGRFPDDSAERAEGASQDSKTCEQFKLLHQEEERGAVDVGM